jgi:hypothetical protein
MTELCKIMNDYGSDKGSGWHNYTDVYYDIFKDLRDEELNIFELGLGPNNTGASLRGWKKFFPKSKIYGGDIDKSLLFTEERIETFYCDQTSQESISLMWDNPQIINLMFDIIIEDGLHEFEANLSFFENSVHKLKKGGLFIIEDLNMRSLNKFKLILPKLSDKYYYLNFDIIEIPNSQNQYDNNILVVKYPKNSNDIINLESIKKKPGDKEENNKQILRKKQDRKIIDCFTFYNELEILELRLTEMYDVVDYFILAEADKTHKGENKSLIYEENKEKFAKWSDKIINIKVSFPSNLDVWGREKYQRNSFMPVLYSMNLNDDDIILITDADEIPNPERINYIKEEYHIDSIYKLEMDMYFGCLENKQTNIKWYHPKLLNWGTLKKSSPDECRLNFDCLWWENGGWHFTYFGDPDKIANKINNFAHQEYNNEIYKDADHITDSIKKGKDLFKESRNYIKINPKNNPNLPKNWRILEPFQDLYKEEVKFKLIIGNTISSNIEDSKKFIDSLGDYNNGKLYVIAESEIPDDLKEFFNNKQIKILKE